MSLRPFMSLGTLATAVLVLLLWTAALHVPTPTQPEPLRVAVGLSVGTEPWIMAREAGELPFSRVNLVEMNWTSAAMRAVGNRVVDAAVMSLDEVIRQIHQGYALKIVMVTDISRGADMLMARRGIENVKQLQGGRIGYEPRTAGAWFLGRSLQNVGLDLSQVQQVPLNPAEIQEIFQTLHLDAVVLSEPWNRRLKEMDLHIVFDSSHPGAEIVRVLAVHPDSINSESERVILSSLIEAHFKWTPRLAEGGKPLEPILRREGVSWETFQEILGKTDFVGKDKNHKLLTRKDPWLADLFVALQKGLVEDVESSPPLDPADVFEPVLLEEMP